MDIPNGGWTQHIHPHFLTLTKAWTRRGNDHIPLFQMTHRSFGFETLTVLIPRDWFWSCNLTKAAATTLVTIAAVFNSTGAASIWSWFTAASLGPSGTMDNAVLTVIYCDAMLKEKPCLYNEVLYSRPEDQIHCYALMLVHLSSWVGWGEPCTLKFPTHARERRIQCFSHVTNPYEDLCGFGVCSRWWYIFSSSKVIHSVYPSTPTHRIYGAREWSQQLLWAANLTSAQLKAASTELPNEPPSEATDRSCLKAQQKSGSLNESKALLWDRERVCVVRLELEETLTNLHSLQISFWQNKSTLNTF